MHPKNQRLLAVSFCALFLTLVFQNCGKGIESLQSMERFNDSSSITGPGGTLAISAVDSTVSDRNQILARIQLNQATASPLQLRVRLIPGSAIPGVNYTEVIPDVTIPSGQSTASLAIPILRAEGRPVTFSLKIDTASAGQIVRDTAQMTIPATLPFVATDTWSEMSLVNSPSNRSGHTAIWTGTRMVVFGGFEGPAQYRNDGGIYDPVSNQWQPLALGPPARRFHTAVWTGAEMIIYGGRNESGVLNDGWIWNLNANTWRRISQVGAPSARNYHTAIWTGRRMLVFGGYSSGSVGDGASYDPVSDTWSPLSTLNAPGPRGRHTAVWTGTKMIIYGGDDNSQPFPASLQRTGGIYDPSTDSWTPIQDNPALLLARVEHSAVWTGSRMIVFGGLVNVSLSNLFHNSGAIFDPESNLWQDLPVAPIKGRWRHTATWTGNSMMVYGGEITDHTSPRNGARYDPLTNTWTPINETGAPARGGHTAVWTGSSVLLFGGGETLRVGDGTQYSPTAGGSVWK